jgi:hypothetical protein
VFEEYIFVNLLYDNIIAAFCKFLLLVPPTQTFMSLNDHTYSDNFASHIHVT